MTNQKIKQAVATTMEVFTNYEMTAQAIALGCITSCDDTVYTNFELAVMIVEDIHNVFIDGSSIDTLQVI